MKSFILITAIALSLVNFSFAEVPQQTQIDVMKFEAFHEALKKECKSGYHALLVETASLLNVVFTTPGFADLCPPLEKNELSAKLQESFGLVPGAKTTVFAFMSSLLRAMATKTQAPLNAKLQAVTTELATADLVELTLLNKPLETNTPGPDRIPTGRLRASDQQHAELEKITTFRGLSPVQFDAILDQAFLKTFFGRRALPKIGCRSAPITFSEAQFFSSYLSSQRHFPCLTHEERTSFRSYVGNTYTQINRMMRKYEHLKAKIPGHLIGHLETGLEKITPLGPKVVFRGLRFYEETNPVLTGFRNERYLTDLAFLSTSLSSKIATNFGGSLQDSQNAAKNSVLMVLLAKSSVSLHGINSGEEEVLLHPQTMWEVVYRKQIGATTFLFAEEIDHGPLSRDFRGE